MTDDDLELKRLDEIVAENDAIDSASARWYAAEAVEKKAAIVERCDGPAAALELYADVARRLAGCREPAPREMLIDALNVLAHFHDDLGHPHHSREVAETLIAEHFDDPPEGVADVVVNAAFLLARLRDEAGEKERAVELLDRLIDRYGHASAPDGVITAAAANCNAGLVLGSAGRLDESIRRYGIAIDQLADPADSRGRRILAEALARQAYYMYEANRPKEADARCREVLDRFAGSLEPEIAENVRWTREMLAYEKRPRRRRFGFRS